MKTRLVAKLSLVLMALLAVILYKTNDYFKDEKYAFAQQQVHNRVIGLKTSVAGQITQLRNILSSYETEINEAKINWVQLAPFYFLADARVEGAQQLKVGHVYGRSGSAAQSWNKDYIQTALNLNKANYQPDTVVQLFRDQTGGKYIALNFRSRGNSRLIVAGPADYFQKYFDIDRGGRFTTGLLTDANIIAAHSEVDYVASLSEERKISDQKYLAEFEEMSGTNLTVMTYALKKNITSGFSIPWSVVGLIIGFGLVFIAILSYGLDPMEKRIERYRNEEKKLIFEKTLGALNSEIPVEVTSSEDVDVDRVVASTGIGSNEIAKNQEAVKTLQVDEAIPAISLRDRIELRSRELIPVDEEKTEATLVGPLQQAIFNMDRSLKIAKISISKSITSNQTYELPYKTLTRAFEEVLKLIIESAADRQSANKSAKQLVIQLTDSHSIGSVVEFVGSTWSELTLDQSDIGKLFEKIGGEIIMEKNPHGFKLSYLIAKKQVEVGLMKEEIQNKAPINVLQQAELNDQHIIEASSSEILTTESAAVTSEQVLELDLDQILALDETSEEFKPAHTKIIDEPTVIVSSQFMENKSINFSAPKINLNKRKYEVDELNISVRRPEKC